MSSAGDGCAGTSDDLRGHAGDRHVRRHVVQHHAAGADFRAFANFDVADDLAAGG